MKKYFYTPLILVVLVAVLFIVGNHATIVHAQSVPCTNAGANNNLVCLTAIPGLGNITTGSINLIGFFNSLYKICIGIAAALALVEIIYAGVTWMSAGDSTERVGQAKTRIQNAVFGLLLVLSPVIVFGIINPNVLSLSIDVSPLTPSAVVPGATPTGAGATGTANTEPGIQVRQACNTANNSDGECAGYLICTGGKCAVDSTLDNGDGSAGAACQPSAPNCGSGLVCDTTDTCATAAGGVNGGVGASATGGQTCSDGTTSAPGGACISCPGIQGTSDNAADCAASTAQGQ